MPRRTYDFQTIHSEGGLLPSDLLRRVLDPKDKLPGTQPEDYGLPPGERLNEAITQSWNRLRKHWTEFRAACANLPEGEAGTGLTNDKWNLPLLRELGFGLLPTSAGPDVGGRTYAINRFFGPVPIHLLGCGLSLDRRAAGVRGAAAANPHGLVQEFLNRSDSHLWAIVSNGLRLRLLRDNQALSRQSFLEFDLESMFTGEVYSDFVLLWLMAHATRFAPREANRPETCWLEQWTKIADEQGTRALGDLRGGVERALQILGEGFTSHPKNTTLRDALRTGQVTLADFHGQLLRVVYQLIFLFVAEDRTLDGQPLLHPRDGSDAARLARGRYAAHYSTARLRELAAKIKGTRHGDLWRQFQLLVGALSGDAKLAAAREHLALPALGSFLWDLAFSAALNDANLTNHDFLEALRHLAFTRQGKVLRSVDYKNLGAEELGGVYESLLALTPQISADGARFSFAEFAGSERKMSGSYYTPDSLVQCLLDSALDPVVVQAIQGKTGAEVEKAILSLKVCDPAVGSGHFLVGAAHRLARHLARVRALAQGESEPSPLLYQHALRDVIGRCLYGVDVNPMAAELCRVSLWLEALEPGKALSFLDHHIRVGNSLLGTTPEIIAEGIPDEAFDPIEGDDKKICSALKKKNKEERAGQQSMMHLMVAETQAEYNSIETRIQSLDETPDGTIEEIRRKAEQFTSLVVSPEYRHNQLIADTWCAAFVWKKQKGAPESITTDTVRRLEEDPEALTPSQRGEIERLAAQYRFFHWHLAFPEVINKGGFDCVLGNPPWEQVKLEEKEWFAIKSPMIASAKRAVDRKRLINDLNLTEPRLLKEFLDAKRVAEGVSHFARVSGVYPLAARGDQNTYGLFTELSRSLRHNKGRIGIIIPTGIVSDLTYAPFFSSLIDSKEIVSITGFINSKKIFADIKDYIKFALVVLGPSPVASFQFLLTSTDLIKDPNSTFTLSREEFQLLNPNTKTCPIFGFARDAEIVKHVYRNFQVLIDRLQNNNAWGASFLAMFHMSSDSDLFLDQPKEDSCPLYEAKFIWHYEHRFSSYENATQQNINEGNLPQLKPAILADPYHFVLPRYWVDRGIVSSYISTDLRWFLCFRGIAPAGNQRTAIFAVVPKTATSNSCPLLILNPNIVARKKVCLIGQLNSFAFDYVARQKIGGPNLNFFIIEQLPVFSPELFDDRTISFVAPRLLELVYTAWDLEVFAQDFGWSGPPFLWEEERRFLLRCELDAAFFHLYLPATPEAEWKPARVAEGAVRDETPEELAELKRHFPRPRDAVAYIMDTFPIVRRKDEEKYEGDYRTKRVILEMYDEMVEAMRTGNSYKTRLDPPPADPRCCHPRLKIGILAYGSLIGDPGEELQRVIRMRIKTITPFPVEFGRYSGKTRGGAPTLTKHDDGGPVSAEILVLDDSVSEDDARNMLWRRERQKTGTDEKYSEGISPNSVLLQKITDDPRVSTVLYTDFKPGGKIEHPVTADLAKHAIQSVKVAEKGKDGISYLMNAIASGIKTPLTAEYEAEILKQTGTRSLKEALQKTMTL